MSLSNKFRFTRTKLSLQHKDVRKKLDAVYKEAKPKEYVEKVDKCMFSDLMELWCLDVIPSWP